MSKSLHILAGLVLLATASQAAPSGRGFVPVIKPDGKGDRTRNMPPRAASVVGTATTDNGIQYHGGAVMGTSGISPVKIYYIWYGNWAGLDSDANAILTTLANNIGGSPYFNINTTYTNASNQPVLNQVSFGGAVNDNYSKGKSLSDSGTNSVASVVTSHLGKDLPSDTKGVYFVLTTPDVVETSGFCSSYCGWHSVAGSNIKIAFVGDGLACGGSCQIQGVGPNGSGGGDAMASVISHELEESVTDPNFSGWYVDANSNENGDQCSWTFGSTYTAANGAQANMNLGGRDFMIQQNWVNASGGYCAQSYSTGQDFSLAASPTSVSATQGGNTTTAITVAPINGFIGAVNLSVSGLPSNATAGFSPASVPGSGSSTLTLSAASTTPAGSYPLTITGTSGGLTRTASVTLTVNQGLTSACDLNKDGSTNVLDVQQEVNMALTLTSCTADINLDGVCNVLDVQRVTNAALGGQCVSP